MTERAGLEILAGSELSEHQVRSKSCEERLLSRKEAAAYLGLSQRTLAIWATTGRYGLEMIKIGRLAKYRKSALDSFINERIKK